MAFGPPPSVSSLLLLLLLLPLPLPRPFPPLGRAPTTRFTAALTDGCEEEGEAGIAEREAEGEAEGEGEAEAAEAGGPTPDLMRSRTGPRGVSNDTRDSSRP